MDARLDPAKYAGLSEGDAQAGFYDVGTGPGSTEAAYIDCLTIADRNASVVEDVARIRRHPLVPKNIPIYGYVYEVETGKLLEIPAATVAGAAR